MRHFFALLFTVCGLNALCQEIKLNSPNNVKANLEQKGGKYFVHLSWDKPQAGDTLTESYFIFNNYPPKKTLYLNGAINRLNQTEYLYEIKKPYAAEYLFAVRADAYFPYEYKSGLSDTISIIVPSTRLPTPNNLDGVLNGNTVSITWTIQEVLDLDGFEINIDGEISNVEADKRSFKIKLDKEIKNGVMVKVTAFTKTGVRSAEKSKVLLVAK